MLVDRHIQGLDLSDVNVRHRMDQPVHDDATRSAADRNGARMMDSVGLPVREAKAFWLKRRRENRQF